MYAADGRTMVISKAEVDAYKNVGWYTEPVCTMYAADGRTIVISKAEVETYKNIGWYLPYDLNENEKSVIRAMLYGIGNNSIGNITNVSDTYLVKSILSTSHAEYNSFNSAIMVNYTENDSLYSISENEMRKAMKLMYSRQLNYHVAANDLENISSDKYTYYSPNGRGGYGEIIINNILGDDKKFIVNYMYNTYLTAEHSLYRIADTSINLMAEFSKNENSEYPFCLLSVYDTKKSITAMKRIYPDTTVKQKILTQYFVLYSSQDYFGERFKFNDNGTVEIVKASLQNNKRYYDRKMGIFEIGNDSSIEISEFQNGKYQYHTSFNYDKEKDYFYDYEYVYYESGSYSPEPDVIIPINPNDKGVIKRNKVFTYSSEPSLETMAIDWNNRSVTVAKS